LALVLWDQCFSNKAMLNKKPIEHLVTTAIIALAVLFIIGFRVISAQANSKEIIGFLIGLVIGQVAVHLNALSRSHEKYKKTSRLYNLIVIFIVSFIFAFNSKYLLFGYFAGFGVSICFGYSLLAWVKNKDQSHQE
jgi:O-antigen/teichoic acid export membrane protein